MITAGEVLGQLSIIENHRRGEAGDFGELHGDVKPAIRGIVDTHLLLSTAPKNIQSALRYLAQD